jgi:hypothetical protein
MTCTIQNSKSFADGPRKKKNNNNWTKAEEEEQQQGTALVWPISSLSENKVNGIYEEIFVILFVTLKILI